MNEFGQDLVPGNNSTKLCHDPTRIAPVRVLTDLAGHQSLDYLVKQSFNKLLLFKELHLPWMKSANILAQGTVPTNFHHDLRRIAPRRAVIGLVDQNHYLARQAFV